MTCRLTDECTRGKVRGGGGRDGWVQRGAKRSSIRRRVVSIINIQEIPENEMVGPWGEQSLHVVSLCKLLFTKVLRIYDPVKGT